jgi:hypothetical protein
MNAKEKGKPGFWDYDPPAGLKMTVVERGVDFLLWSAKTLPGRPVPIEQIVRVAMALPKLPREDANVLKAFKQGPFNAVRRMLYNAHQTALIYHPGAGYRATTGSEDAALTYQEMKARGVASAVRALTAARAIIKRNELKPATRSRFDEVGVAHKALISSAVYDKLLASSNVEDDKK